MSRQSSGKTLLRNVIRHTDAHNKIQEESEMWKMRDWEIQKSHPRTMSDTENKRRRMYCDQPRYLSQSRVSEHDDREARYWTRKLYEFESNDPDRWGHSGFKELYPEEFKSDSEESPTVKTKRHKTKKSKSEAGSPKRSKKSSRKKKKKKKKKSDGEKRKKAESLSSSDDTGAPKDRQRRKKRKSPCKNHKYLKISKKEEESSSEDSSDDEERERRTSDHKKRKLDSHRDSDSGLSAKKRRRNWKEADEESSRGSSAD
ncbi:NKAP domain containing 1 [Takifugu flavidus]|uniref:NKAP domain containing protein 1 n=2 Tax=Takifugu TaxID=31032 RepID=A0A5C6PBA5_9TELE|nr:NKAP domain containing 1 [Takifugu flavidus]TNN01703.1 hypothetical protein fugu_011085 [Takifugu bimaculatus]TWW77052.1 NKAP domain containing protein 1 [Takifugu flavidus]